MTATPFSDDALTTFAKVKTVTLQGGISGTAEQIEGLLFGGKEAGDDLLPPPSRGGGSSRGGPRR